MSIFGDVWVTCIWIPCIMLNDIKPECLTDEARTKYRKELQDLEVEKYDGAKSG